MLNCGIVCIKTFSKLKMGLDSVESFLIFRPKYDRIHWVLTQDNIGACCHISLQMLQLLFINTITSNWVAGDPKSGALKQTRK